MRKEKGFTLIELLVVIAILGVIAAVVALNVGNFFNRGTVQAANTELHQAQVAIIACMSDADTGLLTSLAGANTTLWSGEEGKIWGERGLYPGYDDTDYDAADYIYRPFRATYTVSSKGKIIWGTCNETGQWGDSIIWNATTMNWQVNGGILL